jgi:tripartite-type tricarboxylate transporter receptor subunit TctC
MKFSRRAFLRVAAGAAALPAPNIAKTQTYPTRPVRIVVGFPAGGIGDITARLTAQWLSDRFGQPVIVENRPGAAGNLGTEIVVRSPADGYTLFLVNTANAVSATLYEKLNFNFIRDIAPIAAIMRAPSVMEVNPSFPAKTVAEFIAYAKSNPGKINMASAGNGTLTHVSGELFEMMAGINMVHVPYRGDAPAVIDLLRGQVQVYFGILPTSIEHIRTGKLRPLAITSAIRSDALPDLPTIAEFLPGYEASGWYGVGGPRDTPGEIIDKLNTQLNAALADLKMKGRLADLGGAPMSMTPADFRKLIEEETEKWAKVVKFAGIKPD